MVGYPFTDEVSHQFMGLVSPTDADGDPNPCYDVTPKFADVQCTGRGTAGRVAIREGYIRSAYQDADEKLGIARSLMGGNPTTFAGSDHGFAPAVVRRQREQGAERRDGDASRPTSQRRSQLHAGNADTPPNCGAATTDITKACWAGGTIQIYINAARLREHRQSEVPDATRRSATAIRNAFQNVTDPANPGKQVIVRILNKEELRDVDGSDSLHPNRSGDVVVVTRPPYQSDAGTNGQVIALSHFFGQHGYLPNYVDIANNINMHATFVLAGRVDQAQGQRQGSARGRHRADPGVPDGHPGPQNARGRDPVRHHQGRRAAPRGHDPRHQRLPRPADPARRHGRQHRGGTSTCRSTSAARRSSRPGSTPTTAEAVRSAARTRRSSRWPPATPSGPRRRSRTSSVTGRRSRR